MTVTINREQRLYVIKSGAGFTCLGFDVAEKHRRAYWAWVGQECPELRKGYLKHYDDYRAALAAVLSHSDYLKRHGAKDWRCPAELTPELIGLEGRRVEVTGPNGYKQRFWVGRSTGPVPIHLEVMRRDSTGGGAAYIPKGGKVRVVA